jgi:hypothetical protein
MIKQLILVLFFLMNMASVLLGESVVSGQLSLGRSVGNDGSNKEVTDSLENIEHDLPIKKKAIQSATKGKIRKNSKRTKRKRKFLLGWRNMMKYFVVSVYDPTCQNHLKFSSRNSSSLPATAVGLVPSPPPLLDPINVNYSFLRNAAVFSSNSFPSVGPVCGPNGCF